MISTTIKSFIQADLASVWHSVTSLYDYSWRSDIKDIEVSDERHFKEISNEGYVTCFTITVLKPFLKYSFLMDNENFSGEWTGHFRQIENVWGIERSGFFSGREKWVKSFENQRV